MRNKQVQSVDIFGKIPPQAIDMEEAVLGALILEGESIEKVNLKPEYFYKDSHQKIFKSIKNLQITKDPIDLLTVTEMLRKNGDLEDIGGPYYLGQLTTKVASSFNIEYHSLIIIDKFIKRELIRISNEVQEKAFDDSEDIFDIVNELSNKANRLIENTDISGDLKSWIELMKESIEEAKKREKLFSQSKSIGIPTPINTLTKWTCGWQPKQLIIIAGRPGMGKTAWALGCLKTASFHGYNPVLFSLEMSDVSIANRIIVGESGIDSDDFRSGNIGENWNIIDKAIGKLSKYNILIDDKPKSIDKIRYQVRKLHKKGLCDLVIVDYIQLSWDDSLNDKSIREQEVSSVSRKLKLLAQELNIPVIALSQLNRQVENRPNKRPQSSDLRESGAIEQDADVILFVYRPDKYGITEDEKGNLLNGRCECILEKQREGRVGTIYFKYNKSITDIYDWDDYNELDNNPDKFIEPNKNFYDEL